MEIYKTHQLTNNKTLQVIQDDYSESPREWDNLGTMLCFHPNYSLGDKQDTLFPIKKEHYNSWDEMKRAIIKQFNVAVILPIYLFDHSGITISTSPFNCRFDSMQIGFIFISKEKALAEYGGKIVTSRLKARLSEYLNGEVKTYDQYLIGDVYGFKVVNEDGKEEDSCWGFYGSDVKTNGMLEHIEETLMEEVTA